MNYAHLHLILTHFPPVLSLGGERCRWRREFFAAAVTSFGSL